MSESAVESGYAGTWAARRTLVPEEKYRCESWGASQIMHIGGRVSVFVGRSYGSTRGHRLRFSILTALTYIPSLSQTRTCKEQARAERARIRQLCGPCQALARTPQAALSQCHWPCRRYFYYLVSWYASTKGMRLGCSPLVRGEGYV